MNSSIPIEAAVSALTLANVRSKDIIAASAALLIYDHATSLDEEVEHFWTGRWTLSRVLYLSIRYLALTWALFQIFGVLVYTMDVVVRTWILLVLLLVITTLCQGIITLRVWFLFYKTPIIKAFALTMYALCISATYIFAGVLWSQLKRQVIALQSPENVNDVSWTLVWLYVPSLVIHTTLFALKVYRFVISPTYMQTDTLLWRFMKEGMFMYAFALGSLLFTIVGLTLTSFDDLPIYFVAWQGCLVFTSAVISVCRAMLSIRSLAAINHVAPAWLLNHAEMSRVRWRHGAVEGEIVVEMNNL